MEESTVENHMQSEKHIHHALSESHDINRLFKGPTSVITPSSSSLKSHVCDPAIETISSTEVSHVLKKSQKKTLQVWMGPNWTLQVIYIEPVPQYFQKRFVQLDGFKMWLYAKEQWKHWSTSNFMSQKQGSFQVHLLL